MTHSKKPFQIFSLVLAALLTFGQPAAIVLADADSTPAPTTSSDTTSTPAAGDTTTPPSTDTGSGTGTTTPTTPEPSTPTTGPTAPTGPQNPTGPQQPTGPTAQNIPVPDYAFDDSIRKWLPTDQSSFTFNQALGRWVSPLYSYDTKVGWYHIIPKPAAASTSPSSGTAGSGASSPAAALAQLLGLSDPSITNTGPGSTNNATNSTNSNALLNFLTNGVINSNDTSTATTGDANVSGNTTGGNATTGAASVVQNLLNLLNAAWSWSNGGLSYFAKNIFGNQSGDLTIDPTTTVGGGGAVGTLPACSGGASSIDTTGSGSTNNAADNCNANLAVNAQTNGSITNNVNALAQSGNAGVTGNTTGGSATSGDATADVNILNLINSAISSGSSFFGLLNIFGNLNGDILFPDGFLDSIGATSSTAGAPASTATIDGTGPGSTNNATTDQTNNATLNNTSNGAFNNNINTAAQSGNADVSGNTSAGSATTGDASTNNNLFNLFNQSLLGDNAVLVLVNVMGHWMGHIMTLPDGGSSTGALLTGNATVSDNNTGPGSTNNASVSDTNNATVNTASNGTITNNVNAGAISGDANVSNNTSAGDATSGAAHVATNVANILGSTLNLKKWFGVLVINVFGDWTGSVGDNTSAGDAPGSGSGAPAAAKSASNPVAAFATAVFKPSATKSAAVAPATSNGSTGGSIASTNGNHLTTQLASTHTKAQVAAKAAATTTTAMALFAALALMLAAAMVKFERRLGRN